MPHSYTYIPVIRNLGVMNQYLVSCYLDLGLTSSAKSLMAIDAELVLLLQQHKAGFDPNQPRVPAGNSDGGQWTGTSVPAHTLSVSNSGIHFIARHEGFSSSVYKDTAGYATIGYGHKLLPGESYPNGITHEAALQLLKRDTSLAETALRHTVHVGLTRNQFDALASFTFNVGNGAFANSTLLRLLNTGDYNGAAEQFQSWNKVTVNGKQIPDKGLTSRRNAERALFLHGKYH